MSGEPLLLDSGILIDHFNACEQATTFLREVEGRACISAITRAEVLSGFAAEDVPLPRTLLDRFPLIVIDREVADLAAELRRQHPWKLPDALQAAAARHHGLRLATRDAKSFPPERFSFVVIPYQL